MTLEFENPPFLSDIALNPSYNNDPDFSALDIGGVKSKKTSVISLSKKNSPPSKGEGEIIREMSDRYSDDYDSYDNDFESPSPTKEHNRIHSSRQSRLTARIRSRSPSNSPPRYRLKKTSTRKDSFASYRSTYGTNRGRPAKAKKTQSAASKLTTKSTGSDSSMMKRILSANRIKVSRLNNIMEELHQEVEELKQENKSLKRVSHWQEKEIKKIEEEEASLPLLLQRHSAEMRTLKENCRRNQEKLQRKEKEAHVRDEEIQKLRDAVNRYQELSKDKKLEERAVLARKLENIKKDVAEKDKRIMDLEKTIMLKDKARQREMKDHKDRFKQAKEELKRVQEDCQSLRQRLQEREKELEGKNIYHQRINQQKKKDVFITALPAGTAPLISAVITAPEIRAEPSTEITQKKTNVFLTNTVTFDKDNGQNVSGNTLTHENRQQQSTVTHSAVTAASLIDDKQRREQEDRLRRQEEERRRLEEDDRRREEERRRREEEEARRKHDEEERRREEEERRRAEEERMKRQREEEERKKQEEEQAENRRKKDLLLARLRAIDNSSQNDSNELTITGSLDSHSDAKPVTKLPIFLQSEKPIKADEPSKVKTTVADDDILSDAGGKRPSASSKHSGYSYEFKQTVENLHHGLPAHASHEHAKTAAAKESSLEELSFGSYKPTVGRRAAAKRESKDKDDLSFGNYNPSFVSKKDTTRRQSGLDFGAGKKVISENEQNGLIFGDYSPSTKNATSKQNGSVFSERRSSPLQSRRARDNRVTAASTFGEDIFGSNDSKPTSNPVFGEKSLNNAKSTYPWENKVNVSKISSEIDSHKDSLLPRRKRLQSVGKDTETNIRAVENALNDVDDDIEEVIL